MHEKAICYCPQIAYILSVNANILSDTGGPCTSADCTVSLCLSTQIFCNLRASCLPTITKPNFAHASEAGMARQYETLALAKGFPVYLCRDPIRASHVDSLTPASRHVWCVFPPSHASFT